MPTYSLKTLAILALLVLASIASAEPAAPTATEQHLLYVATPGIRADLVYGGSGILVFDIDAGHKFVRRIPSRPADATGQPEAMKGVCASALTHRLFFTTPKSLTCMDLLTDKIEWTKPLPGGCDRMSISPDGKTMYVPSFEGDWWNIVSADNGDVIDKIVTKSGSHNTVFAIDGKHVYLAGLRSPNLTIADAETHKAVSTVGPFGGSVRPFTVNGKATLCYCCVNGLLGFEIGDLTTGKLLHRVEIPGFAAGPTLRHGCPSHGIGLSPDETEIWVCDAHNKRMHVFDVTNLPPKLITSVPLREEPGWVTFSIDGRFAYSSTGDVIDTRTKQVIATLEDEKNEHVASEKLLEIDFRSNVPIRAGDQFARGQVMQDK